MTRLPPPVVEAKLLRILHRAFIEARNLALSGDSQQLYELADTFELLPELMSHWNETSLAQIRSVLAEYQSSHPQSGYEYLLLLDADETVAHLDGFNVVVGQGEETGLSE